MDIKAQISDILSQPLPNTKDDIIASLNASMSLTEPILTARCTVQAKWLTERERLRHPKDLKQFTDLDRTIMLDAAVADLQKEYNELKGLEDLLNRRIAVLSSLL